MANKKPHEQDGDESDSKEREGVTGKARKPDPHGEKGKFERAHDDSKSPDGEQG